MGVIPLSLGKNHQKNPRGGWLVSALATIIWIFRHGTFVYFPEECEDEPVVVASKLFGMYVKVPD